MRPKTLKSLKREAQKTTAARGHQMKWGEPYSRGRTQGQIAECRVCNAWVQIQTLPYPNEIDIGGPAVAVSCH